MTVTVPVPWRPATAEVGTRTTCVRVGAVTTKSPAEPISTGMLLGTMQARRAPECRCPGSASVGSVTTAVQEKGPAASVSCARAWTSAVSPGQGKPAGTEPVKAKPLYFNSTSGSPTGTVCPGSARARVTTPSAGARVGFEPTVATSWPLLTVDPARAIRPTLPNELLWTSTVGELTTCASTVAVGTRSPIRASTSLGTVAGGESSDGPAVQATRVNARAMIPASWTARRVTNGTNRSRSRRLLEVACSHPAWRDPRLCSERPCQDRENAPYRPSR